MYVVIGIGGTRAERVWEGMSRHYLIRAKRGAWTPHQRRPLIVGRCDLIFNSILTAVLIYTHHIYIFLIGPPRVAI